ncbi:MAG: DUF559 domain-containing protein [Rickettsiales bacterium]|nr:DUF559 domain-containing protein [Rickettsiales bacterium]
MCGNSPSLAKGWIAAKPQDGVVVNMKLPANKSLAEHARELRKHSTLSEVLLWNALKNKRANGLDFDRQKIIGNYIVDFYCPQLKLVLEIDGSSHDNKHEYDLKRHNYLENLGLTVIHIHDLDVKRKINEVLHLIENLIKDHYPVGKADTPSPAKGNLARGAESHEP